jgi:Flp pilus assembly protein TadD
MEIGLTGTIFPTYLTPLGRKLVGLELWDKETDDDSKYHSPIPLSDKHKEALNVLTQAKQLEADGDPNGAVAHYKKALRLNPRLESYFNN